MPQLSRELILYLEFDTTPLVAALDRAQLAVDRLIAPAVDRMNRRLHNIVVVRGGRRVHASMVRPPRLCIDGHAYRNRTRRRTRRRNR